MMKYTERRDTKGQWLWVFIVRLVGFLMFVFPLVMPLKHYIFQSLENIIMSLTDIGFSCVGFLLFAGGKNLGILANNIGVAINNVLTKLTK